MVFAGYSQSGPCSRTSGLDPTEEKVTICLGQTTKPTYGSGVVEHL